MLEAAIYAAVPVAALLVQGWMHAKERKALYRLAYAEDKTERALALLPEGKAPVKKSPTEGKPTRPIGL